MKSNKGPLFFIHGKAWIVWTSSVLLKYLWILLDFEVAVRDCLLVQCGVEVPRWGTEPCEQSVYFRGLFKMVILLPSQEASVSSHSDFVESSVLVGHLISSAFPWIPCSVSTAIRHDLSLVHASLWSGRAVLPPLKQTRPVFEYFDKIDWWFKVTDRTVWTMEWTRVLKPFYMSVHVMYSHC